MKNIIIKLMAVLLVLSLATGCSSKKDTEEETTVTKLTAILQDELKNSSDLYTVVDNMLNKQEVVPYMMMAMEVEEGWLNGFDGDVTGFSSAVMFGPAIAQPFIGYVFETSDSKALKDTLLKQANLRWNICTEADYKAVVDLDDTHVFFLMSPESFEE